MGYDVRRPPEGYECLHDPACRILVWPWADHSARCADHNATDGTPGACEHGFHPTTCGMCVIGLGSW